MRKKNLLRFIAFVVAILMPITTAQFVFAEDKGGGESLEFVKSAQSYESPDINNLTGHGKEPEDLSVSADATYQEKAWYEYVTYSDKAVASYKLNDDHRLLFYDPYTYTNAMIMDVEFDATTTTFDTMSSYTISHTNSKTMDACISSTNTNTNAIQTSGRDVTHTDVKNSGATKTIYNHSIENKTQGKVTDTTSYGYKEYRYTTDSVTDGSSTSGGGGTKNLMGTIMNVATGALTGGVVGGLVGLASGLEVSAEHSSSHSQTTNHNAAIVQDNVTKDTIYSPDYKTSTKYVGDDTVEYNTNSTTDGWTELSARVTKTIGSSTSTSNSWSETESTTVTKTYAATHFASDGVTPLPWAIVHYKVQMPMKCCLQVKYSGEWVTISTVYCLLTTVQGTCRTWMQNGQAYYEDWGNGEPVVATDFWSQFMTRENLIKAYSDKLYPTGGED